VLKMTQKTTCTLFLALFLVSGCMTAQQIRKQRIEQKQDIFDTYSPDIQEKISHGRVDLGFSQEMIAMAWGTPDRIYTRLTKEGLLTIWTYTSIQTQTRTQYITIPVYVTDHQGKKNTHYRRIWIDHDTKREYPVARVEFSKEGVTAIEFLGD